MENSPVPKIIADESGHIIIGNSSYANLLKNQKIGEVNNFFDLLTNDSGGQAKAATDYVLSSKNKGGDENNMSFEAKLVGKGEYLAQIYVTAPIIGNNNRRVLVVHFIEITQQKILEQRYLQLQKVQAIGQVTNNVAHDFNNLLTGMMGFCDLLLTKHQEGDDSFADIMQIHRNIDRAAVLVRQLLSFAKKQSIKCELVDIVKIVEELSPLIRQLIGENITLELTSGDYACRVYMNQSQLEQIVTNLAVNARDAMHPGSGRLSIHVDNIKVDDNFIFREDYLYPSNQGAIKHGIYVVVSVRDSGTGISKSIGNKIFEPFVSTKRDESGTGLGLSTICGIMDNVNGYIYASTSEGVGTVFYLLFPAYDNSSKANDKSDDIIVAPDKNNNKDLSGGGTILIVEDEEPVRIFVVNAMTNKGYSVLAVDSAESALSLIEDRGDEIDLIITDIMMPGMSGPEMIKQVRLKYPKVQVIYVSGYAEDIMTDASKESGPFHFLAKPFTLRDLAYRVKEVIKSSN
jgi:two-component system cell cycle sensor histidine kinase/response regulator CckA